jgi:hypothetical protein
MEAAAASHDVDMLRKPLTSVMHSLSLLPALCLALLASASFVQTSPPHIRLGADARTVGPQTAVSPPATFTLGTTIAATASAVHAGYATIVFLGGDGKDLRRDNLWFKPSRRNLGEVTTARRRQLPHAPSPRRARARHRDQNADLPWPS